MENGVLVASAKIPECQGRNLPSSSYWATARLLVTRVILIDLVDEFFILSFLVLLKEMRTGDESKISS